MLGVGVGNSVLTHYFTHVSQQYVVGCGYVDGFRVRVSWSLSWLTLNFARFQTEH